MPRSVPLTLLKEMLDCTSSIESELSANSRRHQMRAKKPRSSPMYSGSIRNAPDRSVSEKIFGAPRLAPLTLEDGEEGLHLQARGLLVQMNEDVGTPEVTIVFRDLVFEDQ